MRVRAEEERRMRGGLREEMKGGMSVLKRHLQQGGIETAFTKGLAPQRPSPFRHVSLALLLGHEKDLVKKVVQVFGCFRNSFIASLLSSSKATRKKGWRG